MLLFSFLERTTKKHEFRSWTCWNSSSLTILMPNGPLPLELQWPFDVLARGVLAEPGITGREAGNACGSLPSSRRQQVVRRVFWIEVERNGLSDGGVGRGVGEVAWDPGDDGVGQEAAGDWGGAGAGVLPDPDEVEEGAADCHHRYEVNIGPPHAEGDETEKAQPRVSHFWSETVLK